MRKFLIALLFSAPLAFPSGLFSIGVKGGVPFTDAVNTATSGNLSYVTNNNHWTLGPELDLHLPFGLGIEIDAHGWTTSIVAPFAARRAQRQNPPASTRACSPSVTRSRAPSCATSYTL